MLPRNIRAWAEYRLSMPPETLPRSPGHWVEWVNYAKGLGPVPGSNFQYSGWTTYEKRTADTREIPVFVLDPVT